MDLQSHLPFLCIIIVTFQNGFVVANLKRGGGKIFLLKKIYFAFHKRELNTFKNGLYIKNLQHSHLTPVFHLHISIYNSLHAHTNLSGYCVPKNPVLNESFQDF